jgi:NitT/TauT family transport system substrate-binding protein
MDGARAPGRPSKEGDPMMRRRTGFWIGLLAGLGFAATASAADLGTLKLGVQKFGTVSWELDVITSHELDRAHDFELEVQPYATGDAADVALMGGAVDGIVEDWLWVSRQRSDGVKLTFIPYSSTVGALMVKGDGPIETIQDLKGRKVGVAGGPLDKSWILVQGWAKEKYGMDLATAVEPVYGAPPLLTEKFRSGELDAVLNYWHYCARLEAEGARQLVGVNEAQAALGVSADAPQLGYIFKEAFAEAHPDLIRAFDAASRDAKRLLADDPGEWQRLKPLTRAENDTVLAALQRRFVEGIVPHWGEAQQNEAAVLYGVLAKLGGPELVGPAPTLAPGTFWPGVSY